MPEKPSSPQQVEMIYIFLFYQKNEGLPAWLPLHPYFRHCDYLMCDGDGWVSVTFGRRGVKMGAKWHINYAKVIKTIERIPEVSGYVVIKKTRDYIRRWFPIQLRTCNEMSRIMTGLNISFTSSPYALFKKLLKYNGERNYRILEYWTKNER